MRTRIKKLALPLSLLALGALGLVACGGPDDDQDTTAEAQVSGSTAETRFPAETTTEAKVSPDISLRRSIPRACAGAQARRQHLGIALRHQGVQPVYGPATLRTG